MNAGKLRHRIIFETPDYPNVSGTNEESWTTYAAVDASIEPIRGREWWEAQHENAEVTHRIKCRYTRGITPNMRIKYGNTFFDIQSVIDPSMRNISLEIMATQRVS